MITVLIADMGTPGGTRSEALKRVIAKVYFASAKNHAATWLGPLETAAISRLCCIVSHSGSLEEKKMAWWRKVGPHGTRCLVHLRTLDTQAVLMLDSGRFNLQANTDKIQHLL